MKEMKSIIATIIACISFVACAQTQTNNNISKGSTKVPSKKESVATFSEGCFWHAEIVFQSLKGVRDAVSGYAGGHSSKPDYDEVSSGNTGHAETVQVYYDSSVISFETLVDAFFASQDPTTLNQQGNDVGTEYRSIAFYRNDKEREIINAAIKKLTASKKYKNKIVTQVVPFVKFYPAENYHQEYISQHPENPYVQNVSIPEYLKFRREFKGNYK